MIIIIGADISRYYRRIGALDNRMAYVLGLQRLGHEVYLFGDIKPDDCFDSNYKPVSFDQWEGRRHFEASARAYGIWPRCSLIFNDGQAAHGMSFAQAIRVAKRADLLINIHGKLHNPDLLENVRCRVYVDQSPAQPQIYHATYGIDQGFAHYEHFFTVGLNIGTPVCEVPTCGLTWHALLHPVVLDLWPAQINGHCRRFTTISKGGPKGTVNFNGKHSGDKADNWRKFIELPTRTAQELEIALNIDPAYDADIKLFKENGWFVTDPQQFRGLEDYRNYIARSRAELSIANERYVQFNTGWTSDRTARYLASGKPTLVQSTGIESHLPTGKGLLTFTTIDEALAGIDAINSDYQGHCRAARQIAEQYFDSDKVLSQLLSQVGCDVAAVANQG